MITDLFILIACSVLGAVVVWGIAAISVTAYCTRSRRSTRITWKEGNNEP
jgi:hypothetical protein